MDALQAEVRQHSFSMMLVSGGADAALEKTEIGTLQEFQIEGLILISHQLPAEFLGQVASEVPTVTVTRSDISVAGMDTVSNDDVAGAGLAVDHLVSLGHTRITHLDGGDNPVSHLRAQGYREAMARHGLKSHTTQVSGGLSDQAGYVAAKKALGSSPTALFVANDFSAMGAIAAVEEAGLDVPGDISIIGYDGISLGGLRSVNLTSVAQPLAELGRLAATRLLERIETPGGKAHHDHVASEVIVRGTTGPAPAHP